MNIEPGKGYGKFVLGMTQEEVIKTAGDADLINDLDEESEQYIIYYYYDDQVKLFFDKDKNYKLISLEIFERKASLYNTEIIDLTEEDLKKLLYHHKLKITSEEYPSFNVLYVPSKSLYFNIELNRVRSVEMQPFLKNSKVVWPKGGK